MTTPFLTVEQGIAHFRAGKMLILVDDENRENEGDLIIAADHITPEAINFMTQYGRGLVCMPLHQDIISQLHLPKMVAENHSRQGTPFTVSIGAAQGITTGISATDRARTVQAAANPAATPNDIVSPGHIFPLCADSGGVLARRGHTEGCVDLARLAGLRQAAVLCEITNTNGTMARMPELEVFAKEHDLGILLIDDIAKYRLQHEALVHEQAAAKIPIKGIGDFTLKILTDDITKQQFVVLQAGELKSSALVRIHSECFTGDLLGSMRCDCGSQLHTALQQIHTEGGVLLYMPQEGRGIGLLNKIKAYALQDNGLDTVEANHKLGLPIDSRDYGWCAQILKSLGVNEVRLLTNNPKKIIGLETYGVKVKERVALEIETNPYNEQYLQTKKEKLGHLLNLKKDS